MGRIGDGHLACRSKTGTDGTRLKACREDILTVGARSQSFPRRQECGLTTFYVL